jgi:hypothetical protein
MRHQDNSVTGFPHHHPAWTLLFYNPDFWACVGKNGFMLRAACKEFRLNIPEQVAIRAVFCETLCRKVDLFRLLPLSVNDVIRMRSPVNFVAAFDIAVRRWGGFDSCMAFVREWGWINWNATSTKRRVAKDGVDALIRDSGFECPIDDRHPIYQSIVACRKRVDRVVVWRYSCTYEDLLPREQFDPYRSADGVALSRRLFSNLEFNTLLRILRDAFGFWYKGIHADVRAIEKFIRGVRNDGAVRLTADGGVGVVQHQLVSGKVLILGVVTFRVWE